MRRSTDDEKILGYNDVVLRKSDLGILSGPHYLNDRIIEFYFSYLATSHPIKDVLLVAPSVAFWIANCPDADTLKDFVEPLELPKKRLVIFPVNNNNDVTVAEGGSHWSLLVYERSSNAFIHHDSCYGINKRASCQLYGHIKGFMSTSDAEPHASYVELTDSPQQLNSYDCGLYVTAIARSICLWIESNDLREPNRLWFSAVKEQVTPSAVADMRGEILELITTLVHNN
ncbi:hypothetical protein K2173_023619 [Erythroxylum novogranatense]|uniref:Ubiquitin-like protease family profile domain-containing protein n=1 Tax=Erythroxylum novogranatense TaxID=1862640 RepID=A0AAV8TP48_9ROSI|nr:hypothetical protein K2173_023619 [Erythroxylum novogranatense]